LRPPFPFLNCSIEYSPFYPQKRAENQKLAAGKPILPGETGIVAAQMDEPLHAPGANQILLHQSIRHMTSVEAWVYLSGLPGNVSPAGKCGAYRGIEGRITSAAIITAI
jgi:hypothetical protein